MKILIKTLTTILIFSTSFVYSQSYTCPSGYSLEGNQCVDRVTATTNDNRVFYWSCSGSAASDTRLAGNPVNCSTGTPPQSNPVCGSANGTVRSSNPSSGLCSVGTSSSISTTSTRYNWSCINGSSTSCFAYRSPTCGSANGGSFSSTPSSNLCSIGTNSSVSTGATSFNWSCSNGGSNINCSATKQQSTIINGKCTSKIANVDYPEFNFCHSVHSNATPENSGCAAGNAYNISQHWSGVYIFSCQGINGGNSENNCYLRICSDQ